MKEWHVAHMEKTVVRYVKGLSADASSWEKRQHKKYGNATSVCRQIDYDIKHGVEKEQVLSFLEKVRVHASFSDIRKSDNSLNKLDEIKEHFVQSRKALYW
jgi:hypothetical protein